jgi:hypothetical protein
MTAVAALVWLMQCARRTWKVKIIIKDPRQEKKKLAKLKFKRN